MFYLRKLEFDSSVTIISLCVLEKPWHTHFYRSYSHVKLKFYTSYRHVDKVITLLHMHSFHHYLAENTHFHIFETGPPGITFHLCCHLLITLWHTKKYYIFAHTHTHIPPDSWHVMRLYITECHLLSEKVGGWLAITRSLVTCLLYVDVLYVNVCLSA